MIGSESMAEGMAGKTGVPAKKLFLGPGKGRDAAVGGGLGWGGAGPARAAGW